MRRNARWLLRPTGSGKGFDAACILKELVSNLFTAAITPSAPLYRIGNLGSDQNRTTGGFHACKRNALTVECHVTHTFDDGEIAFASGAVCLMPHEGDKPAKANIIL
jgi:hypothetical protein